MKSFIHFVFSFVLIFSILVPSLLNLYGSEKEAIVLMDTTEEEKQEKTEKDLEEKILQLDFFLNDNSIYLSGEKVAVPYLENHIDFSIDIYLPPPELFV